MSEEKLPEKTKEQKLKDLQKDFEQSRDYWKEHEEKAEKENQKILKTICSDNKEKYNDLIKIPSLGQNTFRSF